MSILSRINWCTRWYIELKCGIRAIWYSLGETFLLDQLYAVKELIYIITYIYYLKITFYQDFD